MLFTLYQVDRTLTREFGFRSYEELTEEGKFVELKNYNTIYNGEVFGEDVNAVLGEIFHRFNVDFPDDYPERGRSMAVSDLILLDNRYFFCDSFGWEDVTNAVVEN